ncbi:MAG: VIT1/CCC1 transporter family protein [Candidatus Omnitrophica bacterium]|nr:VIT1/CCC1 transporter family protein [Candidatus Omnitrophota bacterium]
MNKELILKIQKTELTDHFVYKKLSGLIKINEHSRILARISDDELKHYQTFKSITGEESVPDKFRIFWFVSICRFLGLNFGLKLMESGEGTAQETYERIKGVSAEVESIIRDEEKHEKEIISLIDEEMLKYISSVVLGLSDALVEFMGALAGFTLALQNTRLIGVVGLVTGIAASLSMASSEYLSTKHGDTGKNPFKASIYTGITYMGAVLFLILPYFLLHNVFISLGFTIINALLLMFIFTFYISVAKDLCFKKRFLEMASLSLSVAAVSFFIGLAVRKIFNVDI